MSSKTVGKNVDNLFKKNNMKKEEVAQILRIKKEELENKLKGKEEFTAHEIVKILNLFDLSSKECSKIFFSDD